MIQVLNLYESESGNQANQKNVHLNQLLKSNLSQENKAEKRVLIDLAPFNFSKADLLERLEENWFQKTAFVSFFLLFQTMNYFLKIVIIKGGFDFGKKEQSLGGRTFEALSRQKQRMGFVLAERLANPTYKN